MGDALHIADLLEEHVMRRRSQHLDPEFDIDRDDETGYYSYAAIEVVADHDFLMFYLLDIRTKPATGKPETRDYLYVHTYPTDKYPGGRDTEWRNKPLSTDSSFDDHLDRVSDGMKWFGNRVVSGLEEYSKRPIPAHYAADFDG